MGNKSAWSDVGYGDDSAEWEPHGYPERVVFSVHHNIVPLLHRETLFKSAAPGSYGTEMHLRDLLRTQGHGEFVPVLDEGF